MVVEDEPTPQETLVYNLENQGYSVETVTDGQSALTAAREALPDLIVLDIMLTKNEMGAWAGRFPICSNIPPSTCQMQTRTV